MPLQRQTVHFPFTSGIDNRSGKVHSKPPQLSGLVNGRFDKIGKIGKRNGFVLTTPTISGGVTPRKWLSLHYHNKQLVALTDVGPYVLQNGAWAPLSPSAQTFYTGAFSTSLFGHGSSWLFGTVETLAKFDASSATGAFACDSTLIYDANDVEYAVVSFVHPDPTDPSGHAIFRVYVVTTSDGLTIGSGYTRLVCGNYTYCTVTPNSRWSTSYIADAALCLFSTNGQSDFYSARVNASAPTTITFANVTAGKETVNGAPQFDVTQRHDAAGATDDGWAIVYQDSAGTSLKVVFVSSTGTIASAATITTVAAGWFVYMGTAMVTPGRAFTNFGLFYTAMDGSFNLHSYFARVKMSDGSLLYGPQSITMPVNLMGDSAPDGTTVVGSNGVTTVTNFYHRTYPATNSGDALPAQIAYQYLNCGRTFSRPFFITLGGKVYGFVIAGAFTTDDTLGNSGTLDTQPSLGFFPVYTDTGTSLVNTNPSIQIMREKAAVPQLGGRTRVNVAVTGKSLIFAMMRSMRDSGSSYVNQCELVRVSIASNGARSQVGNGCLLIPDMQPMQLSNTLLSAGAPVIPPAPVLTGQVTGSLTQSQPYTYMFVMEWYDSDGNFHQSAPSLPAQRTITGGDHGISIAGPGDWQSPDLNDESRSVIAIYRSKAALTTMYRIGTIPRGTTAYSDEAADSVIGAFATLYANGGTGNSAIDGELENQAPLAASVFCQTRDRMIYIPSERPFEVRASKPFVANAGVNFHGDLTIQVPKQPVNLGTVNDTTIVLAADAIYRLDGDWPDQTGQGPYPTIREVARGIGCVDAASCYETPVGLIFKCATSDTNGWMLIDLGFQIQPIGANVMDSNDLQCCGGQVLGGRGEIWLFHTDGTVLVYDWIRQQWASHALPTTGAIASVASDGTPIILNADGTILRETAGQYQDTVTGSPVGLQTTIETGWYSFADTQGYQRVYSILLLGEWSAATSLSVAIAYDYDETVAETKTIDLATDGTPTQVKLKPARQKCQAVKLIITVGNGTSDNSNFYLEDIAFEVGVIGGPARIAKGKVV